jgi:hypothetical protein
MSSCPEESLAPSVFWPAVATNFCERRQNLGASDGNEIPRFGLVLLFPDVAEAQDIVLDITGTGPNGITLLSGAELRLEYFVLV